MIGNDWDDVLAGEWRKPYWARLMENLNRVNDVILPPRNQWFSALEMTSYADTKVVILGQDPYFRTGQAHGLAFSVLPGVPVPPSLMNIYQEIVNDVGGFIPDNGYLVPWAQQGVLLLNTTLTVSEGKPNSHKHIGWSWFTDSILYTLNQKHNIVFLLWGRDARIKGSMLDRQMNLVLEAAHPSPLAGGKFFGCKHFSKCNQFLYETSATTIDWQIPMLTKENRYVPN